MATEQVARMQEEVKVERAEKAKLAEGVKALASKSDQLAQEIQQNRPLAPNTIFNQFVTNRVQASFWGVRSGFLGLESNKRTETQTVLVTDGTNTVALCHVQDTPLSFGFPGTEWEGLTGTLGRNTALFPSGPCRSTNWTRAWCSCRSRRRKPGSSAARFIAPRRTPTSSRTRCWWGRRRATTGSAASRSI